VSERVREQASSLTRCRGTQRARVEEAPAKKYSLRLTRAIERAPSIVSCWPRVRHHYISTTYHLPLSPIIYHRSTWKLHSTHLSINRSFTIYHSYVDWIFHPTRELV